MKHVGWFRLSVGIAALSCPAMAGQLEGWWRFAGLQGDVANDVSGNGRDALIDASHLERIGEAPGGGALYFSGVEAPSSGMAAFVAVPGFSGVCLSNALSVCAWVNADSLPPFAPLAVRASDLCAWADGFGLYVGESGGIGAYVRSGDDGNAAEGGILSTGTWNHVAMTYSGTELKLYVNGKPVASRTFQTAASADASAPLAIGSLRGKMGEPQFTGAIADVRVWSKALSPQEVRAAYLQFIGEAIDPSSDDDGDGMPNGWEVRNGFDPRDPVDADLDSDGDGVSNLQECRLGRNPRGGMVPSGVSLIKSGTAVGP